jgi:multiple sugar transport system substrate-binding protein
MMNNGFRGYTRRSVLGLGAAGAAALAFGGCASREGGAPSGAASASSTQAADFGGGTEWKKFSGTTLSVLLCEHWWTTAIKKKFADFESLTGITLKPNTLSEDSYYQQALVALSSGAGTYDAIMVGNLQAGQYMKAGWLAPLDSYFTDGNLIDTSWFNTNDFFGPARKAGSSDGSLLALPISAEAGVVMYRKSLLSKAGISSFATQDALVDACSKLTSELKQPFVGRGRRGLDVVWAWTSYFLTAGGEFFDGTTSTVNSAAGVEATELYIEKLLKTYGPKGASNMSWLEATGQVNEGNAAIYTDASGLLSVVLDKTQSKHVDDITVARWPDSANGSKASPNYWYWLAGVPAASKNKDAAALFYAWAMSPQVSTEVSSQSGSPSARQSVWKDDKFLSFYPGDTATEITANLAAVQPDRVPYGLASFPEQADALGLELVNVLTQGKNVQAALDAAARAMEKAA